MNAELRCPCSFVSQMSTFRNFMNNGDPYKLCSTHVRRRRSKLCKNNYLWEGFFASNIKTNFLNCDHFLITKETPTELPLPPNFKLCNRQRVEGKRFVKKLTKDAFWAKQFEKWTKENILFFWEVIPYLSLFGGLETLK